ncbi:MAG: response regulator [Candidatus Micrarchaeota archaeon]|nr:response regulator [Candidatus Micrarchaeota archaeon]
MCADVIYDGNNDVVVGMKEFMEPIVEGIRFKNVLLIEDNPEYARNALDALKEKGYEATLATTRQEAFRHMRTGKYDFVLSDLNFPTMSGREPTDQTNFLLSNCLLFKLPLAVVTKGDHHGVEEGMVKKVGERKLHYLEGEERIFIRTFMPDDILECLREAYAERDYFGGKGWPHLSITHPEFMARRYVESTISTIGEIEKHRKFRSERLHKDKEVWKTAIETIEDSAEMRRMVSRSRVFNLSAEDGMVVQHGNSRVVKIKRAVLPR